MTLVIMIVLTVILTLLFGVPSFLAIRLDGRGGGEPETMRSANARLRSLSNVCLSEQCIEASNMLFKSMNLTLDPCQDFYQFTCGRFIKETTIPDDRPSFDAFTPVMDSILERGRIILEERISEESDWPVFKKAKQFYRSCMNTRRLEELGLEPIKALLRDVGGWPVLEGERWRKEKNESGDFRWYEMIYAMNEKGFNKNYIVGVDVGTDVINSTSRTVYLDQPTMGMRRIDLLRGFDDRAVQNYFVFMTDMAVLLGASPEAAAAEMKEALLFEIELAGASAPEEERRDPVRMYNPVVLGSLESLPGHPPSWAEYVRTVLLDAPVDREDVVVVNDMSYLVKVSSILARTKPRAIANYLAWQLAQACTQHLNEAVSDVQHKYATAMSGTSSSPIRWKLCVEQVGFGNYGDAGFRIPAASMYLRKYFSPQAKLELTNMIKYLKEAFHKIIDQVDWMDPRTKARARSKLQHVRQFVAYPDEILDRDEVEGHHRGIEIGEDDFIGNALRLTQWDKRLKFARLKERVDKDSWLEHSLVAVVNAFYSPTENSIQFPAGILQGVFYKYLRPSYANFGAIGGIIGHELTHAFDDMGRQFDHEGNLYDWWEEETKAKFLEKAQCIIDQYGGYNVTQVGMSVNGRLTQGENIADNGGIKETLMAYEQWVIDNGFEEPSLPGHNFTPRQMLFINWGQIWCGKHHDPAMMSLIHTGPHSPPEFRVNGPLKNLPQFAEAFKCPLGSAMNPRHKCSVW